MSSSVSSSSFRKFSGSWRTEGGAFVTKVDLYFGQKDDTLPVEVEIREVINGYPGPKVIPFGRKVLNPADVNVSATAATATTFTFPSPVYLKDGTEYCIAIRIESHNQQY